VCVCVYVYVYVCVRVCVCVCVYGRWVYKGLFWVCVGLVLGVYKTA